MKVLNKLKKVLKNPYKIFIPLGYKGKLNWMDDKTYLRFFYRGAMGKKLNLKAPKTFNEKIQWLKLYDRNPEYSKMVDKYEAKIYVAEKIGEEYIIPTFGVWDNFDDIDFSKLPNQFVLKCTHDCGGLVICKDKSKLDINEAREKINNCLKKEYFWGSREWPYRAVKPRIIAEAYMEDEKTGELRDYKFFSFDGEAKVMFIASERQKEGAETKFDFFDMDYNHLPFTNGHVLPEKPATFEKMAELAGKLSVGIPQVRVDFYDVNGHIYFGELTFSHWGGIVPFDPDEWDYKLGDMIKLPR